MLCMTPTAQAQRSNAGQFGLGVAIGTNGSGIESNMMFSSNASVGMLFAFETVSGGGNSATALQLSPYFRYEFGRDTHPFFQVGFDFTTSGGNSTSGLFMGVGILKDLGNGFALHADVDLLNATFTNGGQTAFGWGNGRIGCLWYF